MRLKQNSEIVGCLSNVDLVKGKHKLTFSLMREVVIPAEAIPFKILKDLQGQRIGILHMNGGYKVRKISK